VGGRLYVGWVEGLFSKRSVWPRNGCPELLCQWSVSSLHITVYTRIDIIRLGGGAGGGSMNDASYRYRKSPSSEVEAENMGTRHLHFAHRIVALVLALDTEFIFPHVCSSWAVA
jgi:hypothetical protein